MLKLFLKPGVSVTVSSRWGYGSHSESAILESGVSIDWTKINVWWGREKMKKKGLLKHNNY